MPITVTDICQAPVLRDGERVPCGRPRGADGRCWYAQHHVKEDD